MRLWSNISWAVSVCPLSSLAPPLFPQFIAPTDRSYFPLHRLSDARRAEEACVVTERGRDDYLQSGHKDSPSESRSGP